MAYSTAWSSWTSTTSATTTSYSTNDIWYSWSSSATTSATSTVTTSNTSGVWRVWIDSGTDQHYATYKTPELTAEEKAEQKRRVEAEKAWQEEFERKKKEKEAKARELLRMVLDEEQNKNLDEKAYFELTSIKSGNKYRIRKGDCRNIEKVDNQGKVIETLCFHPKEFVPHYDTMTIQKLMLENEEEDARQVANISRH